MKCILYGLLGGLVVVFLLQLQYFSTTVKYMNDNQGMIGFVVLIVGLIITYLEIFSKKIEDKVNDTIWQRHHHYMILNECIHAPFIGKAILGRSYNREIVKEVLSLLLTSSYRGSINDLDVFRIICHPAWLNQPKELTFDEYIKNYMGENKLSDSLIGEMVLEHMVDEKIVIMNANSTFYLNAKYSQAIKDWLNF